MDAIKIMIIRHAEKPADDNSVEPFGVSESGQKDPEELTVQGWQRAGALVRFFAPVGNQSTHAALATPGMIFASGVGKHSNSLRPQHTVLPLSRFLGIQINVDHKKGDEDALAADVSTRTGTILVAWEHQLIPTIVARIVNRSVAFPQNWPGSRFDLVWVLDRPADNNAWSFTQVPQMILSGDKPKVVPLAD